MLVDGLQLGIVFTAVGKGAARFAEGEVVDFADDADVPASAVGHVGVPEHHLVVGDVVYPHVIAVVAVVPHIFLHRPAGDEVADESFRVNLLLLVVLQGDLQGCGQHVADVTLVGIVALTRGYLVLLSPHADKGTDETVEHVVGQGDVAPFDDALPLGLALASVNACDEVAPLVTHHIAVVAA